MCDCNGGPVGGHNRLRPRPLGFGPAPVPKTFPSPVQGAAAKPASVVTKTAPHPTATRAVQIPNPGEGRGIDRRGVTSREGWRAAETPHWGSRGQLAYSHFVRTPTSSRVQVLDTLYDRGDLAPKAVTPRIHRQNYPALEERRFTLTKVTDQQMVALAKARADVQQRRTQTLKGRR
jgi:hypothetical protein